MLKRVLIIGFTVVALLAFSVTAMASPPENGIVLPDKAGVPENAERPFNNPMDVPGIK